MARVWDASTHSGTELLMLLAIADFADDAGNAYPAVGTLAEKCRMSSRNANFILTALRQSGELEVRANEGPKGTNRYKVLVGMKAASPLPLKPTSPQPLKRASPPDPEAHFTPEVDFTLKPTSSTPEAGFPKPLKPTSDEPSLNHHEPSKKESTAKRKRKTQISEDWQLNDKLMAWTLAEKPGIDVVKVLANFRDHYIAKDELRADWEASWRTWVRNERVLAGPSRHNGFDQRDYGRAGDGIPE
jgi:hypothetical protein